MMTKHALWCAWVDAYEAHEAVIMSRAAYYDDSPSLWEWTERVQASWLILRDAWRAYVEAKE